MRINRIKIENIRNIDSAELIDLKDRAIILITGPNGSGKSALFEAIRIFKSSLGRYSPRYGLDLRSQYPNLITIGKTSASITIEFLLNNEEKNLLKSNKDVVSATVNIDASLNVNIVGADVNILNRILSSEFIENPTIGKIEHIPSDRNFSKGNVSGISFSEELIEQDRLRMIEDTSAKYINLKNDLLWMHYADIEAEHRHEESPPKFIEGVRKIFNSFLDNVEFLDVNVDTRRPSIPKFLVGTLRGHHEIDNLSSGQKEIIMTYSILEKRKFTNSIVLFDEPELHLNGALERKVLSYIRGLAEKGNQFFIATHSPEIIGAIRNEAMYKLTGANPNTAEKVDLQSEKIQVLKELGATHHIQMISRKIVFVEGETDQEILEYFDPNITHIASFVPSKGVGHLKGATELLNRASAFENFRAILDREDLTENQIIEIEKRHNGKVHVWRKREIENYLLDETVILEIINTWQSLKKKSGVVLNSMEQVLAKLCCAAEKTKKEVIARAIENNLHNLSARIRLEPNALEDSLKKALERRELSVDLESEAKQSELIGRIQTSINVTWNSSWREICLGKETLKSFIEDNFEGSANTLYPIFVENICKKMAEKGRIPEEISQVLDFIRN